MLTIALAAMLAGQMDRTGEITERLTEPVKFTLQSNKAPGELEYCVADAISTMGSPAAFRDGPSRVVVTGSGGDRILAAIDLTATATGTSIVGHVRGRGWDDRLRERIARCL